MKSTILLVIKDDLIKHGGTITFADDETYTVEADGTHDDVQSRTHINMDDMFIMFNVCVTASDGKIFKGIDVYRIDDIKSITINVTR